MPLTFPSKNPLADPAYDYTAASIAEITIDLKSRRVVIKVEYGRMVGQEFFPNKNIVPNTYIFDGPSFVMLATKPAVGAGKSIYDNVKDTAWELLIANGKETGSVV